MTTYYREVLAFVTELVKTPLQLNGTIKSFILGEKILPNKAVLF